MSGPVVAIGGVKRARGLREPRLELPHRYVDAVGLAGGIPIVLPYGSVDALARTDALVLAGGGDVDPSRYGNARESQTDGVDADRDASEIELVREALSRRLPMLAICRGAQVLNVALGGTLTQHVEDHRVQPGRGCMHALRAETGSRIERACGAEFEGWSSHHQTLDRLGKGLRATAWAPDDGAVEGAELDEGWVVAVQWHPEQTVAVDTSQRALFAALLTASGL